MKKKLIALLLCGFTTFSLFGCTSTETKKPETDTSSDATKDDTKDAASDSASNTENKDEAKGPDYESVSYTHLDVYKRQTVHSPWYSSFTLSLPSGSVPAPAAALCYA